MIVCPTPGVWFAAVLAALLNDERMLLSVPLALAFILYDDRGSWRMMVGRAVRLCIPVLAALALGVLVRHMIQTGTIGGQPVAGAIYPPWAFGFYPWIFNLLGFLAAFMFIWVLPVQTAVLVARHERGSLLYWSVVALYVMAVIIACASVWDYWRSIACVFPLFLICLRCIETYKADCVARWAPVLALLMAVTPKTQQIGRLISWNRPLLVSIYEYQTNELVMDKLRKNVVRQPGALRRDLTLRLPDRPGAQGH